MKKTTVKKKNQKGFSVVELIIAGTIVVIILGILSGIIFGINRTYSQQRPRMVAVSDANAALDLMARLIRMAGNNPSEIAGLQGIDPGVPVSGQFNTIRIRSDWHGATAGSEPDGDTADTFEDVTFSVATGRLMKQELPADTVPVEFLDQINSLRFTYFDTDNAAITDPVTNQDQIARVDIEIDTQTPDTPAMTFRTTVQLRTK
ncbi:MAG: prepilin-type N-terminal cleavage/methylation domain-containing protein [Acidobacteriota bacterium]|nr:prepilin-type N-terminal cleavage/methylation domain-containing protein [Acidobacteriota bacterium]MDH3529074.1 prepilin-type N-terminal cleavage/methylation domain-containing protein [Acidobacteriota bacterium]